MMSARCLPGDAIERFGCDSVAMSTPDTANVAAFIVKAGPGPAMATSAPAAGASAI